MSLNFGLSETGFVAPTYEELLDDIESDFQTKFGTDIALGANTNFGILARSFAWYLYQLIGQLQDVYYSAFVSTASGTALDRLANNVGITRKVAMPATGQLLITTDGEYLLQAGEEFETEGGVLYELIGDTTTTLQADGKTYSAMADVQCEDTGELGNAPAGTVTLMANPDDMVLSVTNPQPMGGGQDDETDEAFRARIISESKSTESATVGGLETALSNLPGVKQVKISVAENTSGNASDLVYIYVLGGSGQQIADAIAEHVALGTQLRGSETYQVADYTGVKRDYSFSWATSVSIYAQVKITKNNAWNTETSAGEVQEAIADYINGLTMGSTVRWTKLFPAIYAIDGVEEAEVTIGKTADSLASADIALANEEAPTCSVDQVKVVVS